MERLTLMDPDLVGRLRAAVAALEDKKAYHLVAFDVSTRTSLADVFLLCSVGSSRQAVAAADEVDRRVVAAGMRPLSVEGYPHSGWILMDYGDFIVHIFEEERREYYALERLWGDAPDITPRLQQPGT